MPFLRNTAENLLDLFEGGGGKIITEGLHEIEKPVRSLISGEMFKSPGRFAQGAMELPFQSLMGGALLYPALKPDNPEFDTAGPLEELGKRSAGILSATAAFAPSMWKRNFLPGIGALVAGDFLGGAAGKHLGRAADSVFGMRPTPEELHRRFYERIAPRVEELKPQLGEDQAMQQAAGELFQESPDYLDALQQKD